MFELIVIAMFVGFWRYGVVDAIASWRGQPTARAQDRALRQEAAAKAAHERRQANLGPTVGQALAARLAQRIADQRGGEPKPPREPDALYRMASNWWMDVVDDADRRHAERRMARLNAERRRDGLPVIDVEEPAEADIVDGEVVEEVHWCAACRRHEVPQDGWRCPDCARSGYGEQTPPVDPPDDGASEDIEHPHCIRHDMSWRGNGGCPACAPATSGRHCSTCTERLDPSEAGPKCAFCLIPDLTPPPLRRCSTCECNLYDWEPGPDCQGCEVGIQVPTDPDPGTPVWDEDNPGPCQSVGCGETADCPQGLCIACDHGRRPCRQCPNRGRLDDAGRCFRCAADHAAGGPPFTCPQCHATPVEHATHLCGPCVGDPSRGPDQAAAPETSEPTPGPDTTTGGTPTMTQANVIDGDINDPTGAKRFTDANAATLRAIADQCELMIARSRGGKLGNDAVRELELIRADILACVGTIDQATAEFAKHVVLQANIGAHDDLGKTVQGTYADAARATS